MANRDASSAPPPSAARMHIMIYDNPQSSRTDADDSSTQRPAGSTVSNFLFLSHEDTGDADARKQVRSRAAQHSHRIGPRKPKASKKTKAGRAKRATPASNRSSISAERPSSSSSIAVSSPLSRRQSQSSPALTHPGNHADDPFEAYPVPAQPWFPRIMHYMWDFMLNAWTTLPTSAEERQTALLWVQRLTMSEPTYFLMNVMSVAGDLVQRGQMDHGIVLWLNAQVVAQLNLALGDAHTALAAATILTVGRIALHEIVVGDYETGRTVHRPAFARMLRMAGGVAPLGLPRLVQVHLTWAERLMERKTGVGIAQIEPALADEPTFSSVRASSIQEKAVLDKYLPMRPKQPDGL